MLKHMRVNHFITRERCTIKSLSNGKNRRVVEDVSQRNRATLQVAGRYSERTNDVRAQINEAQIVNGQSANVFGGYGCDLGDVEVLIATPLSGWVTCNLRPRAFQHWPGAPFGIVCHNGKTDCPRWSKPLIQMGGSVRGPGGVR
jgi:hypothetical protein